MCQGGPMRVAAAVFLILFSAMPAMAAVRSIVYYLDGARVKGESTAVKGYLEIALPGNVISDSLHIRPDGKVSIARVEIEPARVNPKLEKEIKVLLERKILLEDRLKALDVREEIFKAAAKSQSSKAPRKTKNNPEPIATIRKGTEFAVAQLEDVYRARRKAEEGLKGVDSRLAALKKDGSIGGSVAKVWVSGRGGVTYDYLVNGTGWVPSYDFRLGGKGEVEVTLHALLPRVERSAKTSVVLSTVAEAPVNSQLFPVGEGFCSVALFKFPLEREMEAQSILGNFAFSFRNISSQRLIAGEGSIYRGGEYYGKIRFSGCLPGETKEIIAGKGS